MEKVRVEEFLQPKAMLTPGIAGGVTMLIANALWVAFSLPPRWTSLALSSLLGLLVRMAVRWVRRFSRRERRDVDLEPAQIRRHRVNQRTKHTGVGRPYAPGVGREDRRLERRS